MVEIICLCGQFKINPHLFEAIYSEVRIKFLIFDVFQNSEKMAGKIGPHLFEVIYPEARNVKIMVGKII